MSRWEKLDALIGRAEQALIAGLLGLMILIAFSQIALRNFFSIGLSWPEPLVRYLVLWVGFLGAALAVRESRHITIEVASLWRNGRGGNALKAISHGCSSAVCALMCYAAAKFVQDEYQIGSQTFLDLPVWVPELVIPVAFAVMTARYLVRFFLALRFHEPARKAPPHSL
jgi:TRAP-type C4-dicarboxylate transport system permease small subunit